MILLAYIADYGNWLQLIITVIGKKITGTKNSKNKNIRKYLYGDK